MISTLRPVYHLRTNDGDHVYTAVCTALGRSPLWALYTSTGKHVRFYTYRSDIARAHPNLKWRPVHAEWRLLNELEGKRADIIAQIKGSGQ